METQKATVPWWLWCSPFTQCECPEMCWVHVKTLRSWVHRWSSAMDTALSSATQLLPVTHMSDARDPKKAEAGLE